jgi:hypothetical protein
MMTMSKNEPRRFAPLKEGSEGTDGKSKERILRGVVFDVDGTLWLVSFSFGGWSEFLTILS